MRVALAWGGAHILYGSLCVGGLGTDGMFEVLSMTEGADRLTVVVVVVVDHVDTAVEGMEHPMSNFSIFCFSVISYLRICEIEVSLFFVLLTQ